MAAKRVKKHLSDLWKGETVNVNGDNYTITSICTSSLLHFKIYTLINQSGGKLKYNVLKDKENILI